MRHASPWLLAGCDVVEEGFVDTGRGCGSHGSSAGPAWHVFWRLGVGVCGCVCLIRFSVRRTRRWRHPAGGGRSGAAGWQAGGILRQDSRFGRSTVLCIGLVVVVLEGVGLLPRALYLCLHAVAGGCDILGATT